MTTEHSADRCRKQALSAKSLLNLKFKFDRIDFYVLNYNMQEGHNLNCQCDNCKLGNLPVLLEGIEKYAHAEEASTSTSGASRKKMKCDQCDKTFTHRGDMNKHLRIHSGEKPFSCHVCKKEFTNTSNLTRHLKVHTGDRPFHCDNCGKDFSRKDKLDLHKNTRICKKRSLNPTN